MRAAVVILVVAAALLVAGTAAAYLPVVREDTSEMLSASDFARALAGTVNSAAGGARIAGVHCVAGQELGHYMCSYAVQREGRSECHLMQGELSPETMRIVVTLAGRTDRCTTLREAVQSLR